MQKAGIYDKYVPQVTPDVEISGSSFWFVCSGNKLLVHEQGGKAVIPYFAALEELNIAPVRIQYLGLLEGRPCWSAEVDAQAQAPQGLVFRELRSLYGAVEEGVFLLAGRAFQVVMWDQSHQFCGRCGTSTKDIEGERAKICPKCGFISYPRICPAVITAVIKEGRILLAHAPHFPANWYSIIAGFVEPGETLEECVHREIMEEVGITVKNVRFFGSQPWPFPNSLMIGFFAEYESGELHVDGKEIADAGWYSVDGLPSLPPQLSIARRMIDWYVLSYKGQAGK